MNLCPENTVTHRRVVVDNLSRLGEVSYFKNANRPLVIFKGTTENEDSLTCQPLHICKVPTERLLGDGFMAKPAGAG